MRKLDRIREITSFGNGNPYAQAPQLHAIDYGQTGKWAMGIGNHFYRRYL